jgi:hypothetical protein
MEAQFLLIGNGEKNRRLSEVSELCLQARSVEELILTWVSPRRSLVVSRNVEAAQPTLGFSFVQNRETHAIANIPLERFLPAYPDFEQLNEKLLYFDDQMGFSPDCEWFDKRNSRLGITVHDELDINLAPPSAIGELVLSYAVSSVGFAEICQTKRFGDRNLFKMLLVFFGPDIDDPESGWYENACVNVESLRSYVPRAFWM